MKFHMARLAPEKAIHHRSATVFLVVHEGVNHDNKLRGL
jgi:hypothetical protein